MLFLDLKLTKILFNFAIMAIIKVKDTEIKNNKTRQIFRIYLNSKLEDSDEIMDKVLFLKYLLGTPNRNNFFISISFFSL